MKKLILVFIAYLLYTQAQAQQPYYFSQFFKVAPAFNPAFTGVDNFLDIKLMHRGQWNTYEGSPTTDYIGVYKGFAGKDNVTIKEYSLRISNPDRYDSLVAASSRKLRGKTKHGIGGFVTLDSYTPFSQLKGNLNYSFHLNIKNNSFLAFGVSVGITNDKLDFDEIHLGDENDQFLNQLKDQGGNNTSATVTPGILFYSPRFYIGYSAANLGLFEVEENALNDDFSSVIHYMMAGYQFPVGGRTNLQASVFYYYFDELSNNLDISVKADFNNKGYVGVSYRKTNNLVAMAGFTLRSKFQFGYAYDMKIAGRNNPNNNVHELSLGFLLFNRDLNAPYTW